MERERSYIGIDVAKFVMAIFVLALHTNPFLDVNKGLEWCSRSVLTVIAVPFFFIANGFFALRTDESAKRSIQKLLALYLIWSVVYLPFTILKLTSDGKTILDYFYRFFVYGSYDTIWYLLAASIGLLLVWLLKKWKGIRFAFVVMLCFHFIAILGTSYAGTIENTIVWNFFSAYYRLFFSFKNGLFFGGVYIALGGVIRESLETPLFEKNEKKRLSVFTSVLFLAMAVETVVCKYFHLDTYGVDMKIMLIPFSLVLFELLLNFNCKISERTALFLRKMSVLVFLTQRLFLTGFELLGVNCHSLLWFLLVACSTMAFSLLIILASRKIPLLKKMY